MTLRQGNILRLLAVLALAMHLMAGITPLWLPDLDGQTIQICTTQGLKTVTLDENGNAVPASDDSKSTAHQQCPFCTVQTAPSYVTMAALLPVPQLYRLNPGLILPEQLSGLHLARKTNTPRAPPIILS